MLALALTMGQLYAVSPLSPLSASDAKTADWRQAVPKVDEVGAQYCTEDIAPIKAPFAMPELQRPVFPDRKMDISKNGAKAGKLSTAAIQKCIDKISAKGGGTVIVPAGEWLTGRITLKDNVNLHLEEGAVLQFSGEIKDYLPVVRTRNEGVEMYSLGGLIYADHAENIAVTGKGTLSGPGTDCEIYKNQAKGGVVEKMVSASTPVEERIYDNKQGQGVFLPMFFAPMDSRNVLVEGVTFNHSIFWNIVPVYCDGVIIRGVTVDSYGGRTDGIDIESTRNVLIEYVTLGCGDDCFTLKAGRGDDGLRVSRPTENVVIRYCVALRGPGGMTCGSETAGVIRNVYMHDCVFTSPNNGFYFKTRRPRGGGCENMLFERVRMISPGKAFRWDMLGSRAYVGDLANRLPKLELTPLTPFYRDIVMKDIIVEKCSTLIHVTGIPEMPLTGVLISRMDAYCGQFLRLADVDGLVMNQSTIHSDDPTISVLGCSNIMMIDLDTQGKELKIDYQDKESRPVLVL